MGGNITSNGIYLANIFSYAIQAIWTGGGTPVGTFKLQGSNDNGESGTTTLGATQPTNWTDITTSSQAITGNSGSVLYDAASCGYRWVRLVYTRTSGTATLSANMNTKGA